MPPTVLTGVVVTTVFTGLLLLAERRGSLAGRAATKPVAALGFLMTAYGQGALESPWGRWVFGGLVLSVIGDVLLIPSTQGAFLAGLGSFLLGHVAFAVAFLARGVSTTALLLALPVTFAFGAGVWRWLGPHVDRAMRVPVIAYVGVISTMAALGVATFARSANALLLAGAVLFALSDVSVARDRFVAAGFSNKLWGLPLYFAAQQLIAMSTG